MYRPNLIAPIRDIVESHKRYIEKIYKCNKEGFKFAQKSMETRKAYLICQCVGLALHILHL